MLYGYRQAKTHDPSRRFRARLRVEELETRTLPSAYTPAQILHAYGIDQIKFNGTVKGDGSGQTIAIVDAYYDPTIKSDLAAFSTRYNLPQLDGAPGHGTFVQLDMSGGTQSPPGDDWTLETALDVEWAHAVAPKANIVLVEAASDYSDATGKPTDLLNAVHTAATYSVNGSPVVAVSMSWGMGEVPAETSWDSYFTTPNVAFFAASGDSGAGTIWPSVSPNVVSVGGTTLKLTRSNTISNETGWGYGSWSYYFGGSGGGFSQYEPLPSYQKNLSSAYTQYGVRLNPDVAYDADPNTGFNVLDGADGGWYVVGGTSAGAPQWAALIAIADQGRALNGQTPLSSTQTLNALYSNPGDFHDIKSGSTGYYYIVDTSGNIVGTIPIKAGPGYDLVTGLGTPIANLLVPALATGNYASVRHLAAVSSAASGSGGKSSSPLEIAFNPDDDTPAKPPASSAPPVIRITVGPVRVFAAVFVTQTLIVPSGPPVGVDIVRAPAAPEVVRREFGVGYYLHPVDLDWEEAPIPSEVDQPAMPAPLAPNPGFTDSSATGTMYLEALNEVFAGPQAWNDPNSTAPLESTGFDFVSGCGLSALVLGAYLRTPTKALVSRWSKKKRNS